MIDSRTSVTPRPNLSEYNLERSAQLQGRQIVICYGGKKGFDIAKNLKYKNIHPWINFIVAPLSIPLGKISPEGGVLVNEIKESHCIVVLFDKKGFFKSETAKKEFRIILECKESRYIPIFLNATEKMWIIKMVKEEFGVDLSKIQYGIIGETNLEHIYDSIRRKVLGI